MLNTNDYCTVLVYEHDHSSRVHIDEARYNVNVKLYTLFISAFLRCLSIHISTSVQYLSVCLYKYMYLSLFLLFKRKYFQFRYFFKHFSKCTKRQLICLIFNIINGKE